MIILRNKEYSGELVENPKKWLNDNGFSEKDLKKSEDSIGKDLTYFNDRFKDLDKKGEELQRSFKSDGKKINKTACILAATAAIPIGTAAGTYYYINKLKKRRSKSKN